MSANRIWIDTTSGTWGSLSENLVAVDVEQVATQLGKSPQVIFDLLNEFSDFEINEFGLAHGKPLE